MIRSFRGVLPVLLAAFAVTGLPVAAIADEMPVTSLPAIQTSGDYRMTIDDLQWTRQQIAASYPQSSLGLRIHYHLSRADGTPLSLPMNFTKYVTTTFFTDGAPERFGVGMGRGPHMEWHAGVDPRGKTLQIHLDLLDPDATPAQTGLYNGVVKLDAIPVPSAPGAAIHPSARFTTPLGAVIDVDSVTSEAPSAPHPKGRLLIVLKNAPATGAADDSVQYLRLTDLIDNAGTEYAQPDTWDALMVGNQCTYSLNQPINPGANTFSISFRISESAPSLMGVGRMHRFGFAVPMVLIPIIKPVANGLRGKTAASGDVSAFTEGAAASGVNPYNVVLWTRDTKSSGEDVAWTPSDVKINYQDGSTADVNARPRPLFWHSDGTPCAAGEHSFFLRLDLLSTTTRSPAVSVSMSLHGETETVQTLDFPNITPPPAGTRKFVPAQSTPLNPFGVTLVSVETYDATHKLSRPANASGLPSEGIAFIVARPGNSYGSDPGQRQAVLILRNKDDDADATNGDDNTGETTYMSNNSSTTTFSPTSLDDLSFGRMLPRATSPSLGGKIESLYVLPIPSKSGAVTLRLEATQHVSNNATQTLTVPLPQIAASGAGS